MSLHIGSELELFTRAANWKAYAAGHLKPFIRRRVLEVGAGIGSNITQLNNPDVQDWLAVEPDQKLAAEIERSLDLDILPAHCGVLAGTLDAVDARERFDTILPNYLERGGSEDHHAATFARSPMRRNNLNWYTPKHLRPGYIVMLGKPFSPSNTDL